MNDQTPHRDFSGDSILAPRSLAGVGLAFAALAVLALAGGTLNVTTSGVTLNVNPRR
jgi:hypothetical protein